MGHLKQKEKTKHRYSIANAKCFEVEDSTDTNILIKDPSHLYILFSSLHTAEYLCKTLAINTAMEINIDWK